MTPRQLEILDFVRFELTQFGRAPTIDEIGERFGIAGKAAIHGHLSALVAAGKLIRRQGVPRGLDLPDVPDLRTVGSHELRAELARRGENLDALARPAQIKWRGQKSCAADGCDEPVRVGHLMCWTHWSRLPHTLQQAILRAYADRDAANVERLVRRARELAVQRRAG